MAREKSRVTSLHAATQAGQYKAVKVERERERERERGGRELYIFNFVVLLFLVAHLKIG